MILERHRESSGGHAVGVQALGGARKVTFVIFIPEGLSRTRSLGAGRKKNSQDQVRFDFGRQNFYLGFEVWEVEPQQVQPFFTQSLRNRLGFKFCYSQCDL